MLLDQAQQLMRQGVMIKHPHCNGHLMMEGGFIKMHHSDGRIINLGSPDNLTHILSNVMTDEWDIVGMGDLKPPNRNITNAY